jgi:hypothetical protein
MAGCAGSAVIAPRLHVPKQRFAQLDRRGEVRDVIGEVWTETSHTGRRIGWQDGIGDRFERCHQDRGVERSVDSIETLRAGEGDGLGFYAKAGRSNQAQDGSDPLEDTTKKGHAAWREETGWSAHAVSFIESHGLEFSNVVLLRPRIWSSSRSLLNSPRSILMLDRSKVCLVTNFYYHLADAYNDFKCLYVGRHLLLNRISDGCSFPEPGDEKWRRVVFKKYEFLMKMRGFLSSRVPLQNGSLLQFPRVGSIPICPTSFRGG